MESLRYVALCGLAISTMISLQGCGILSEEKHLLTQGCGIMRAKVEQYGDKYVADQLPKLCNSTGITNPQQCYNLVRTDLASAIRTTSDQIVNLCTQCLMNMTKPIFEKYGDNVVYLIGNATTITKEVNATLLTNCKMDNVINTANLTAAWNKPLMDALRQTTNSTQAFYQALEQNGLSRLYVENEKNLMGKRDSTIMKVAAGSGFVLLAGLAVVGWRRYPRGEVQRLSPDKRFSRELISEDTELLPVFDAVLVEARIV